MSEKWKIKKVSVTDILGTEVNANSMSKDDFDKLCSNIQKSGLSSTIACYKRKNDGKFVIISGKFIFLYIALNFVFQFLLHYYGLGWNIILALPFRYFNTNV